MISNDLLKRVTANGIEATYSHDYPQWRFSTSTVAFRAVQYPLCCGILILMGPDVYHRTNPYFKVDCLLLLHSAVTTYGRNNMEFVHAYGSPGRDDSWHYFTPMVTELSCCTVEQMYNSRTGNTLDRYKLTARDPRIIREELEVLIEKYAPKGDQ